MKKKIVYCSGPLFSPEDLHAMAQIAHVLENNGYETFLPQRDGLESFVMNSIDNMWANAFFIKPLKKFVYRSVFALDMYQVIERCDCFVFNMNGRVPDEGSVVETAAAFASGKPIILYKADKRTAFSGFDNPMLMGASYTFSLVDNVQMIPDEMRKLEKKLSTYGGNQNKGDNIPPFVKKTNHIGKKTWKFLKIIQFMKPKNKLLKHVR